MMAAFIIAILGAWSLLIVTVPSGVLPSFGRSWL